MAGGSILFDKDNRVKRTLFDLFEGGRGRKLFAFTDPQQGIYLFLR